MEDSEKISGSLSEAVHNQEGESGKSKGTKKPDYLKGFDDKIRLLYIYDILNKLGTNQSVSVRMIKNMLQAKGDAEIPSPTRDPRDRNTAGLFERKNYLDLFNKEGTELGKYFHKKNMPSNETIRADLVAILCAMDKSRSPLTALGEILDKADENDDSEDAKRGRGKGKHEVPQILKDEDCLSLANLVLESRFYNEADKKRLLSFLMRLSSKDVELEIYKTYKRRLDVLKTFQQPENSDVMSQLTKAVIGDITWKTKKYKDAGENVKLELDQSVHYQLAFQYNKAPWDYGNAAAHDWIIVNPFAFVMHRDSMFLLCTWSRKYVKKGFTYELQYGLDKRGYTNLIEYDISHIYYPFILNGKMEIQMDEFMEKYGQMSPEAKEEIKAFYDALWSENNKKRKYLRDDTVTKNGETRNKIDGYSEIEKAVHVEEAISEKIKSTINGYSVSLTHPKEKTNGLHLPCTIQLIFTSDKANLGDKIRRDFCGFKHMEKISMTDKIINNKPVKVSIYRAVVEIPEENVDSLYCWAAERGRDVEIRADSKEGKKLLDGYKKYLESIYRKQFSKEIMAEIVKEESRKGKDKPQKLLSR